MGFGKDSKAIFLTNKLPVYTHFFDLLAKALSLGISMAVIFGIPDLPDHGFLIATLTIIPSFLVFVLFFRTLGSYCYARFSLRMDLSWGQAKKLNAALSPMFTLKTNMEWLPLKEVKELEPEEKYNTALSLTAEWQQDHRDWWTDKATRLKNASFMVKLLTVIQWLLCIFFFIASFLNLPPASYLSQLYMSLFETNSYSPTINALVLTIGTILIFRMFSKDII